MTGTRTTLLLLTQALCHSGCFLIAISRAPGRTPLGKACMRVAAPESYACTSHCVGPAWVPVNADSPSCGPMSWAGFFRLSKGPGLALLPLAEVGSVLITSHGWLSVRGRDVVVSGRGAQLRPLRSAKDSRFSCVSVVNTARASAEGPSAGV